MNTPTVLNVFIDVLKVAQNASHPKYHHMVLNLDMCRFCEDLERASHQNLKVN